MKEVLALVTIILLLSPSSRGQVLSLGKGRGDQELQLAYAEWSSGEVLSGQGSQVVVTGLDGTVYGRIAGGAEQAFFGYTLAPVGDYDGDSRLDFCVASMNGLTLLESRNGLWESVPVAVDPSYGRSFGWVRAIRDLDGDERQDIVELTSKGLVFYGSKPSLKPLGKMWIDRKGGEHPSLYSNGSDIVVLCMFQPFGYRGTRIYAFRVGEAEGGVRFGEEDVALLASNQLDSLVSGAAIAMIDDEDKDGLDDAVFGEVCDDCESCMVIRSSRDLGIIRRVCSSDGRALKGQVVFNPGGTRSCLIVGRVGGVACVNLETGRITWNAALEYGGHRALTGGAIEDVDGDGIGEVAVSLEGHRLFGGFPKVPGNRAKVFILNGKTGAVLSEIAAVK